MATWTVVFGFCRSTYYTAQHAEQMARALTLNGTASHIERSVTNDAR